MFHPHPQHQQHPQHPQHPQRPQYPHTHQIHQTHQTHLIQPTHQTHQIHQTHPIQPKQKSEPAPAPAPAQPHKSGEPTVPVIENPNEILLRFLIGCFSIFCMALCGIGLWCAQVGLNDKTRQSKKKTDIGNALLVISYAGLIGGPIGIILLFFPKINKMFIFVPIFLIFIGVVGTLRTCQDNFLYLIF